MAHKPHTVPLWGLFLALLVLTAAEVGLFEIWTRNQWLMPKYAMVLLLLVFTIPKAMIVLVYFMHLKFEKQLIIGLALVPFVFALLAGLTTLTDTLALKDRALNQVPGLREFVPGEGHGEGHGGEEKKAPAQPDPFS